MGLGLKQDIGGEGAIARESPRRASRSLVLVMLGALALFPLVPFRWAWLTLTVVLAVLSEVARRRRAWAALQLGLLCAGLLGVLAAFGSMKAWPLPPLLAALGYVAAIARVPALGGRPSWLRVGQLDRGVWRWIGGSVGVSALALVVWFALAKPDYGALVGTLFPRLPVPLLFAGVVGFSLVNAALEELIYRGVLLGALDAALGGGVLPVVLQAVAFGIVHIAGFPRGLAGVGLATIYGLLMGAVRRRARGMLGPWLAHVATDIVIGSILLHALF
jgi:membrane protease YdiL (CAAX protease family)